MTSEGVRRTQTGRNVRFCPWLRPPNLYYSITGASPESRPLLCFGVLPMADGSLKADVSLAWRLRIDTLLP